MSIFRAYDIRGIYGQTLDPIDAYKISFVFSKYKMGRGPVFLGMDNRPNSLPLLLSSSAGIISAGIEAVNLGMVPTPLLYFGVARNRAPGGIMITASHNPPQYNGLKLVSEGARPLTRETGISDIERRVTEFSSERPAATIGRMQEQDIGEEYLQHITRDMKMSKDIRVVFETGNGTAGPILRRMVERFGLNAEIIHETPNGAYPNGMVNPVMEETLADLKGEVIQHGADIGIALDVDADRFGLVAKNGRWIPADFIIGLFCLPILRENKGATILADVRISKAVQEFIVSHGGRVKFTKVGHSYIANEMADGDYPLGGEISGHIYFKDRYYGFDDGIYCAVRMLDLLTVERKSLEELMKEFRETCLSPEIRVPAPDELKFDMIRKIEAKLKNQGTEVQTLDGVKASLEDGWFSIRASNTEPALVIRAESESQRGLGRIMRFVESLVEESRSG